MDGEPSGEEHKRTLIPEHHLALGISSLSAAVLARRVHPQSAGAAALVEVARSFPVSSGGKSYDIFRKPCESLRFHALASARGLEFQKIPRKTTRPSSKSPSVGLRLFSLG